MAPKLQTDRRVQLIRTAGDSSALLRVTNVPVRESHKATVHSAKVEISLKKSFKKKKMEMEIKCILLLKEYDLVGILLLVVLRSMYRLVPLVDARWHVGQCVMTCLVG